MQSSRRRSWPGAWWQVAPADVSPHLVVQDQGRLVKIQVSELRFELGRIGASPCWGRPGSPAAIWSKVLLTMRGMAGPMVWSRASIVSLMPTGKLICWRIFPVSNWLSMRWEVSPSSVSPLMIAQPKAFGPRYLGSRELSYWPPRMVATPAGLWVVATGIPCRSAHQAHMGPPWRRRCFCRCTREHRRWVAPCHPPHLGHHAKIGITVATGRSWAGDDDCDLVTTGVRLRGSSPWRSPSR